MQLNMDKEVLDKILRAGKIASQVKREGSLKLSKPGTSFLEVMDYCEKKILELNGGIAWAQFAINDVAAHDCCAQGDERVSKEGDLIKVDIGVHIDGYIADNAMTMTCGGSNEHNDLIKASQNALKAAIKLVRPGCQLWELGEAQYSEAEALGFKTIKNLCGHNLKPFIVHAGISIPTFNNHEKKELEEGMQIAIEPFVTAGEGLVKNKGQATVFMVHKERGVRSPYAKKILEFVKPRNGLPFTHRDLTRNLGRGAMLGLRELLQNNIVTQYPPLAEVSQGFVAQTEHSMIVKDKPIVYTKDDD
jgi:methionyl aminopeptidase